MTPQTRPPVPPSAEAVPQGQRWASWWGNVRVLAIALVLALGLRFWVAEPRYIPSNSMTPTLQVGDRILVEKLSYRFHPPRPGDIIVFHPPEQLRPYGYAAQQAFIKRVVAVPGQTVAVQAGQVWIDGHPQPEPYIQAAPTYEFAPIVVPPDSFLVLGDNRNDSNDSHVWGFLPRREIVGRALLRFWPLPLWRWFF